MVESRRAVPGDAFGLTEIYIDSWNEGFGHLIGFRNLEPERVDRMAAGIAGAEADWRVATLNGVLVGLVAVGPSRDPRRRTPRRTAHDRRRTVPLAPGSRPSADVDDAPDRLGGSWERAIIWTPANHPRGRSFFRATGWQPLHQSRANANRAEIAFGRAL